MTGRDSQQIKRPLTESPLIYSVTVKKHKTWPPPVTCSCFNHMGGTDGGFYCANGSEEKRCVCTCMSSPRRTFPERSRWTRLLGMDGLALSDWQRLFTPTHTHTHTPPQCCQHYSRVQISMWCLDSIGSGGGNELTGRMGSESTMCPIWEVLLTPHWQLANIEAAKRFQSNKLVFSVFHLSGPVWYLDAGSNASKDCQVHQSNMTVMRWRMQKKANLSKENEIMRVKIKPLLIMQLRMCNCKIEASPLRSCDSSTLCWSPGLTSLRPFIVKL